MAIEEERVVWEDAPVDYVYWGDVLWGWGRTWKDINWVAFRSYLTKDEAKARFGDRVAAQLTYKRQTVAESKDEQNEEEQNSAWQKCQIWEIWDKRSRTVFWVSKGYQYLLDKKDDPLQLTGFFPTPPFFLANQTTSLYNPTPDFHLAQDLYNEIDILQTRIATLTTAIQATGVYDSAAGESVGRMLKEGSDNTLIPVTNWGIVC